MSEETGSQDGDATGGRLAGETVSAVATGVLGGAIVLFLQVVAWVSFTGGPIAVPTGGDPAAEMAVFVAVGVALPAGGVALLYDDAPPSGAAAAGTVLLGPPVVSLGFSLPPWQFEGLLGGAVILATAAVLERARGESAPFGE
jgi:CBS-domain-containing membrane protein